MLTDILKISTLFEILITFILCITGSSIKDIYDNIKYPNKKKISIIRIIISSITSSIVVYSFSDYIIKYISVKLYMLICVTMGTIGFQIIGIISNIRNWSIILKANNKNLDDIIIDDVIIDDKNDNNE